MITYTFPPYIFWLTISTAVVALIAVLPLLYFKQPVYAILAGIVALIAGFLAPNLAADKITLDDDKLHYSTGFWFAPKTKDFNLADIDFIVIGNRVRKSEYWSIHFHKGGSVSHTLGDLWKLHKSDIAKQLSARGVTIRTRTRGSGLLGEPLKTPKP